MRILTLIGQALAAGAVAAALAAPATLTPPCPTEDYDGPVSCYWDAPNRGNGKGQSFVYDGPTGTVTLLALPELGY
jgi:hypothetical protein